jgi:hypothetical protein
MTNLPLLTYPLPHSNLSVKPMLSRVPAVVRRFPPPRAALLLAARPGVLPRRCPSPPRYRIDGQATMCSSRGTCGRDGRTDQLATWLAIPSRHEVGEDGAGSGAEAAVTQRHGRVTGGSRGGPPRAGPGRRQEGRV